MFSSSSSSFSILKIKQHRYTSWHPLVNLLQKYWRHKSEFLTLMAYCSWSMAAKEQTNLAANATIRLSSQDIRMCLVEIKLMYLSVTQNIICSGNVKVVMLISISYSWHVLTWMNMKDSKIPSGIRKESNHIHKVIFHPTSISCDNDKRGQIKLLSRPSPEGMSTSCHQSVWRIGR